MPDEPKREGYISAKATRTKVMRITLEIPSDVADLVCTAIAVAGDGGNDPFDHDDRQKLERLAQAIGGAING